MRRSLNYRERRAEIARAAFPEAEQEADALSLESEETAMPREFEDKQPSEADNDSDASETVAANLHNNPFAIGEGDDKVYDMPFFPRMTSLSCITCPQCKFLVLAQTFQARNTSI